MQDLGLFTARGWSPGSRLVFFLFFWVVWHSEDSGGSEK